ncbi:hypothetical protein N8T08_000588 [Aspergillus melleus]|uniref:Uncharacterized protein n=1 Tax=Aspergillus melleus TaxID=138277 RepID=A0ACC3APS1_9EURO|nr:hypothetical protein N8T08_000588 [Aspergillus melleus]
MPHVRDAEISAMTLRLAPKGWAQVGGFIGRPKLVPVMIRIQRMALFLSCLWEGKKN